MTTEAQIARLGRAVRTYRLIARLTQDDIARMGGPSDVTIRGLENGAGKVPNLGTLRKLERALSWPEGTVQKLMDGDAEVVEEYSHMDGPYPAVIDYTVGADVPQSIPSDDGSGGGHRADHALEDQSTPDILTELVGRFREQERRIRELEREVKGYREATSARPRRKPAAPEARNTAKLPVPAEMWRLAASKGENELEPFHEEMRRAGEESQDPGTDEPA